jgi:sodium/proline symporter
MAADSVKSIAKARRISMTWMILCLAGTVAVGFFGIAYFSAHPEVAGPVTENPERVFIELAKLLFNPWIAGVLLSAILAAVMSTLSCQLLVCSSALTEDFYKAFLRKNASQLELVWVGRAMVLVVALIAILLAANPDNRVLGLVSYAWAGFGAAFGPVVLISVLWKGMTRNGALAGIVVGRHHRDRVETLRAAGSVRNHPGLHLRQHRHSGGQRDGQRPEQNDGRAFRCGRERLQAEPVSGLSLGSSHCL